MRKYEDAFTGSSMTADSPFFLEFGNAQHQGARNYQEDYFGFSDTSPAAIAERGLLAVLSDGMGGLQGGRETAVETVSDILGAFKFSDFRHGFYNNMSRTISDTSSKIFSKYNSVKISTGCTLVSAYIYNDRLFWACVGDSRIYLVRGGRMYALNEDHDYLNQLLDKHIAGDCSLKKAMSDPQKDTLASFIGCKKLKIDISTFGLKLQHNDNVLLCSDGIYNSLSECEMLSYIDGNDPYAACDKMVQNVLLKGRPSQDNMTVMLVKFNDTSTACSAQI